MVELTNAQEEILDSLRQAVWNGNFQEVQNVLDNNEHNDIQAVLSHEGTLTSDKGTILDFVMCCSITIKAQVEIIEQIWQEADQKTRDFMCCRAIDSFRGFGLYNIPALKTVIQEIEEHKRVMDLDFNLQEAIGNLDVDQVKAALENCGEDIEKVLMQNIDWSDSTDSDYLLIYPLIIDYDRELNQENAKKIKEIIKLLWDKASPDVRNFWLEDHMVNSKGQNTGDNYIIDSLEEQQKKYANIAGERWLEDFIQEVKDYKTNREIELNEPVLEEIEEKECIAQSDRELAKRTCTGRIHIFNKYYDPRK